MKKFLLVPMIFVLIVGLILTGCGGASTPAPSTKAPAQTTTAPTTTAPKTTAPATSAPATSASAQTITFRYVVWDTKQDFMQSQAKDFLDRLEKKSQGSIKFRLLGGNEVIPSMQQIEAVRSGVVDMSWSPATYSLGIVPEAVTYSLTRLTAQEQRNIGFIDQLNAQFQKAGLNFLMNLDSSNYTQQFRMYLNVKVSKLNDLKGVKVRSSPTFVTMLQKFGISPVTIPEADSYSALQQKIVQGLIIPPPSFIQSRLFEVTNYFIEPGFGSPSVAWFVNFNVWKSIPAAQQKLIMDTVNEVEKDWETKWPPMQQQWIDTLKKNGMEQITLPPDDAKQFVDAHYEFAWKDALALSPTVGAQLQKLIQK